MDGNANDRMRFTENAKSESRLWFSRREAESILALAPRKDNLVALDFAARRDLVVSGALAPYRLIHFATHARIDGLHPELSGLVLSQVDEGGAHRDGLLRTRDIYDLELRADLVVLSACRTAVGQNVRGEGMIGLVRGFMYAGAPRVVASLWDVQDESTAELFRRFYTGLLVEGKRPAAALRDAQVSMRNESRWRAPYHWAGFLFQGDWD